MPKKKEELVSPVQPLESVKDIASEQLQEDIAYEEVADSRFTHCWNCQKELPKNKICSDCGFDLSLVYNLDVEAIKHKERTENEANS